MDMERLRNLAGKYAEYAHNDTMRERRAKWLVHNGLREKTFPFHIEDNGSYFRDLWPAMKCTDPECRRLEEILVGAILAYERVDDDRIIPDRFVVEWSTEVSNRCDELQFKHAEDGKGGALGFETNKPIKNIDADFHKLKRRTAKVDRKLTARRVELAAEVFRGLLPVVAGSCGSHHSDGISYSAVLLVGMQELYFEMAANPDSVHRLFTLFAEDNMALGQWQEDEGLLTINNDGNQGYCSGSSQFTDKVPGRRIGPGEKVLSTDRYGYLEAQEAAGISPDMFAEFLMPHFRRLASKFRIFKFGCCEPVHGFMPHLAQLPNLHKVSVTPWCDQQKLASNCRKDVIWCRKPVPLKLCGPVFDPNDFKAHLRETIDIGADFFVEFVFRDTNRLTGAMEGRLSEACRIIREITGHPEGARR